MPIWDGNETWLVVTAVILWGAFPVAYAGLLSAFYLPLPSRIVGDPERRHDHGQPGREILRVIRSGRVGDAQIGTKEGGAEFGDLS